MDKSTAPATKIPPVPSDLPKITVPLRACSLSRVELVIPAPPRTSWLAGADGPTCTFPVVAVTCPAKFIVSAKICIPPVAAVTVELVVKEVACTVVAPVVSTAPPSAAAVPAETLRVEALIA